MRPLDIARWKLGAGNMVLQAVDRHFGLDLETLGDAGERLDEASGHGAEAGTDIGEGAAEQGVDQPVEQRVARSVPSSISALPFRFLPHADHHVEMLGAELLDQAGCRRRFIRAVSVGENVNVGFDVGEHPPDDVALAPRGFGPHRDTRSGGNLGRAVRRPVVVDVQAGVRQGCPECPDRVGDRRLLVSARKEHDYVQRLPPWPADRFRASVGRPLHPAPSKRLVHPRCLGENCGT